MRTTAEDIAYQIANRNPPFNGVCQECSKLPATTLLPTYFRYLEERVIIGEEVTVTGTGIQVGYAPAMEHWQRVEIPLMFCNSCIKHFDREWKKARFKAMHLRLANSMWIVPLAILFILFLAILPLVSISLAVFLLFALYRNMTRRRADRFLARQLCKIPLVAKLFREDEFELHWGSYQQLKSPQ